MSKLITELNLIDYKNKISDEYKVIEREYSYFEIEIRKYLNLFYKISFELINLNKIFNLLKNSSYDTNIVDICQEILCSYFTNNVIDFIPQNLRILNLIDDLNIINLNKKIYTAKLTDNYYLTFKPIKTIHELFTAFVVTNKLRSFTNNYIYVFSGIKTSYPIIYNSDIFSVFTFENDSNNKIKNNNYTHIVCEDISEYMTLTSYLSKCNIREYINIYVQVIYSLSIGNNFNKFTHYNLTSDNVLIKKYNKNIQIKFNNKYLETDITPLIIDYSYSYFEYDDKSFYSFKNYSNYLSDSYQLLMSSLYICKNRNRELYNQLIMLRYYFTNKINMDDLDFELEIINSFRLPSNFKKLSNLQYLSWLTTNYEIYLNISDKENIQITDKLYCSIQQQQCYTKKILNNIIFDNNKILNFNELYSYMIKLIKINYDDKVYDLLKNNDIYKYLYNETQKLNENIMNEYNKLKLLNVKNLNKKILSSKIEINKYHKTYVMVMFHFQKIKIIKNQKKSILETINIIRTTGNILKNEDLNDIFKLAIINNNYLDKIINFINELLIQYENDYNFLSLYIENNIEIINDKDIKNLFSNLSIK